MGTKLRSDHERVNKHSGWQRHNKKKTPKTVEKLHSPYNSVHKCISFSDEINYCTTYKLMLQNLSFKCPNEVAW